ncbi:hypothetical protein KC19_N046600 [Ceratodon purpureus]|nr:hypothetical protein KC19_N046600 [Ceratodon purpureus]
MQLLRFDRTWPRTKTEHIPLLSTKHGESRRMFSSTQPLVICYRVKNRTWLTGTVGT